MHIYICIEKEREKGTRNGKKKVDTHANVIEIGGYALKSLEIRKQVAQARGEF